MKTTIKNDHSVIVQMKLNHLVLGRDDVEPQTPKKGKVTAICGEKITAKKYRKSVEEGPIEGNPVCFYCCEIMRKKNKVLHDGIGRLVDAHNKMIEKGAVLDALLREGKSTLDEAAVSAADFAETISDLIANINLDE